MLVSAQPAWSTAWRLQVGSSAGARRNMLDKTSCADLQVPKLAEELGEALIVDDMAIARIDRQGTGSPNAPPDFVNIVIGICAENQFPPTIGHGRNRDSSIPPDSHASGNYAL